MLCPCVFCVHSTVSVVSLSFLCSLDSECCVFCVHLAVSVAYLYFLCSLDSVVSLWFLCSLDSECCILVFSGYGGQWSSTEGWTGQQAARG